MKISLKLKIGNDKKRLKTAGVAVEVKPFGTFVFCA